MSNHSVIVIGTAYRNVYGEYVITEDSKNLRFVFETFEGDERFDGKYIKVVGTIIALHETREIELQADVIEELEPLGD